MTMQSKYQILPRNVQDEIDAFGDMIANLIDEGCTPFLLTLMFNHIPGNAARRYDIMREETNRVYSIHATRVCRNVKSRKDRARMPIWFMLPDFPIFKYEKQRMRDVKINDGQHKQGLYLLPLDSRLKTSPTYHFKENRNLYIWPDRELRIIDAKLIEETPRQAVDYICKALKTGRADRDQLFILPNDR
jgi:hypothetical protein